MHACVGMPYKRRNKSSTSDIISYALAKTKVRQMYVYVLYACIYVLYLSIYVCITIGHMGQMSRV